MAKEIKTEEMLSVVPGKAESQEVKPKKKGLNIGDKVVLRKIIGFKGETHAYYIISAIDEQNGLVELSWDNRPICKVDKNNVKKLKKK